MFLFVHYQPPPPPSPKRHVALWGLLLMESAVALSSQLVKENSCQSLHLCRRGPLVSQCLSIWIHAPIVFIYLSLQPAFDHIFEVICVMPAAWTAMLLLSSSNVQKWRGCM